MVGSKGSASQDQDPDYTARGGGGLATAYGTTGSRGALPLLIELIFCLGSIWAKLELAFLASVKYYFNDSMYLPPLPPFPFPILEIHELSFISFLFLHRMDRMKLYALTCIAYNAQPARHLTQ